MPAKRFKRRVVVAICLIIATAALIFVLIDQGVKPTIIAMSQARVEYIAIKAMNNAVKEILGTNIKYTDLINVMTDKDGKISMVQANTIKINAMASETSSMAQDEIRTLGEQGIEIPLGSITRSKLLAGMGPNIKVKMIPIGAVSTDFATEFEQAGINQTRHKIYLILKTQVRIVVPMGSDIINVSTRVPITETIIVGDVPDYYLNVDDKGEMLNLVPSGD